MKLAVGHDVISTIYRTQIGYGEELPSSQFFGCLFFGFRCAFPLLPPFPPSLFLERQGGGGDADSSIDRFIKLTLAAVRGWACKHSPCHPPRSFSFLLYFPLCSELINNSLEPASRHIWYTRSIDFRRRGFFTFPFPFPLCRANISYGSISNFASLKFRRPTPTHRSSPHSVCNNIGFQAIEDQLV